MGGWSTCEAVHRSYPRALSLEAYGSPGLNVDIELSGPEGAQHFARTVDGFKVAGAWQVEPGQAFATLDLEEATYLGAPICDSGRYLLPMEK